MIHDLAGEGKMCPCGMILWGLGGGKSMGRLSPMLASVSESLFPCMSR